MDESVAGTGNSLTISDASDEEIGNQLVPGQAVWSTADSTIYSRAEGGDLDESTPDDHSEYEEVGTIHGQPETDDEPDLEDNGYLVGSLGRIGDLFFAFDHDSLDWTWCGPLASVDEAIEYVCGADFIFERMGEER